MNSSLSLNAPGTGLTNLWTGVTTQIAGTWAADSLRGRFARGAVWSLAGAVISQGCGLGASVITARLLGKEQFGEYSMIQSTVGMLGVFAGMGLGLTATKYVAELRETNPARAGRVIALAQAAASAAGLVAVAALLFLAPWLAARTLNAPYLSTGLRLGACLLLLNALTGVQTGILAGFEAFRTIARVNLVRGVLTFPLAVAGVFVWGLRGAVLALDAAAIVGWILNDIAVRAECRRAAVPIGWRTFWSDRFILWRFSLPAFLGGVLTSPAMWAASSILVHQPDGYSEMGIFGAANQWRTAVAFLPSLLAQPLLSMLSALGLKDVRTFQKLLRANLAFTLAVSSLTAVPLILGSSWLMKACGKDFRSGTAALVFLAIGTVISSTTAVIGQAIASLDRMWWGFALNFLWAVVLLAGAALLVPAYGATGLAGAFLAAYGVHAVSVGAYAYVAFHRNLFAVPPGPDLPERPFRL